MVEDDTSIVPFGEAYETHCARYGREADAPILAFKSRCCTADGITANSQTRLAAYQEVLEKGVTENIFSQYMYKTMVENNLSMWIIKKQFALSAAMSGKVASWHGTFLQFDLDMNRRMSARSWASLCCHLLYAWCSGSLPHLAPHWSFTKQAADITQHGHHHTR